MPKIVKASGDLKGSVAQKPVEKSTGKEVASAVKCASSKQVERDVNQWSVEIKGLFCIPDEACMAEHSMLNAIGCHMSLFDRDELLKILRVFKNQEH